jgi:pSer/pThr/pTyr-binding forkhead associated (FHA) protein
MRLARGRPVPSSGIGAKVEVAQPRHPNSLRIGGGITSRSGKGAVVAGATPATRTAQPRPGTDRIRNPRPSVRKLHFTPDHDRADGHFAPGFSIVSDTSLGQFLEACGSNGPLRLRLGLEAPGAVETASRALQQPFAVIGRDAGADLCLDSPEISRRHVYLQVIAGRVFCIDLDSRTGTHWEDGPRPWGWVDPERGIRIGSVRIRPLGFDPRQSSPSDGGDAPLPTSRSFKQPVLAKASLEFLDSTSERSTRQFNRALILIGRWPSCKVRLEGPEVSRFHGCLVRTPAGIWVVDLLSRGGILVNGVQVRFSRLADGDELRVGPHRIRLRCGHSEARPGESPSLPARRQGWGGRPGSLAASSPIKPGTGSMPSPVRDGGWQPALRTDTPDSLILSLLNEVGRMQQDMADSFQRALMMMLRMSDTMHQDQMALIREELARLHQLTEEQRVLKAELARRPPAPEHGPALRLVSGETNASLPASPPRAAPNVRPEARADAPDAGTDDRTGPEGDEGSFPPSKGWSESDVHFMLARRLAAIQSERQGGWKKILNSLMGGSDSEALP